MKNKIFSATVICHSFETIVRDKEREQNGKKFT